MFSSVCQLLTFNSSPAVRRLRHRSLFLVFAPVWLVLSPMAQALLPPPPPDGGYPSRNTAEGDSALFNLTTGIDNTAIGFQALTTNTTGSENTAVGSRALNFNTTGRWNTAIGLFALFSNTSGAINTACGHFALVNNTTGNGNTATGEAALNVNSTGNNNTATGLVALQNNNADDNTATGVSALNVNTTGSSNTATGCFALQSNKTGNFNTASGSFALQMNTTAVGNTATGYNALLNNKTGINNTGNGRQALQNNTSGSFNIAVGNLAGRNLTTGSNNIDIGNQGMASEAQTIRIGQQGNQDRTFIAGISGVAVTGPAVHVSASGQLGIVPSSARFKDEIKPMNHASEAILQLKPVTFHYKGEIEPDGIPQFGLVAEDVEKVDPKLVFHDEQGKPFTVRYEAVNAMLLNEFLKEHRQVQEQRADLDEMKSVFLKQEELIAKQQKQIEALIATVRKIGERADLRVPAPEIAMNEH
jgi:hypothetical protein